MNNFERIPLELRAHNQWICWTLEHKDGAVKPTKIPRNPATGHKASVTDPGTWGTFEQACEAARINNVGIGFVLTDNDPFAFIDLDQTDDFTELQLQQQIATTFQSYAELSQSGTGLHIICKAAIPRGKRKGKIELYSSNRFMAMTGNVYREAPIIEEQDTFYSLFEYLGGTSTQVVEDLTDEEATETDEKVLERACGASNGEKFTRLLEGDWEHDYPSQSEADFAFVDIVAFYTQNRAQIARIFKNSPLGKRQKGRRVDYIKHMVDKSFDNQPPKVNLDMLKESINEELRALEAKPEPVHDEAEHVKADFPCPPGLIGDIARYVYEQAPRPVPEIATAAAIGIMAGIVGRAYNISSTGLNQYILMLAPTGTGKEAIAKGIESLMQNVQKTVPAANEFVGPGEIASPQALIKYMSKGPNSFVSVVGEFGIALKQMTDPRAPTHLVGLRRTLLDLFNKSGNGQALRPTIYSDKDKNTDTVVSPAYTVLGESTPERFYDALDESMISEGLLPRFTIIEYKGKRPPLNPGHAFVKPSHELVDSVAKLCANALMLNKANRAINVELTVEARELFDLFNVDCDNKINKSDSEVTRHLWNRAHIKALKMAGLVAVGCNPYTPTVDADCARWAIQIITNDAHAMLDKFGKGEFGGDASEPKQVRNMIEAIKDYLTRPYEELAKYVVAEELYKARVVPYGYIQRRLVPKAAFKSDRLGATNAIKRTIQTLIDRGDISELSRADVRKILPGSTGRCFALLNTKSLK